MGGAKGPAHVTWRARSEGAWLTHHQVSGVHEGVEEASGWELGHQVRHQLQETLAVADGVLVHGTWR